MVVFGQKWLYLGKTDKISAKLLCSDKSGSIRSKVVLFGQKWLYCGQSCCTRANVVVIGQKWLYSGKDVLFG